MSQQSNNQKVYNLEPVSSPRVVGFGLKLFPKLLRLPIIGEWMLSSLKGKNKFYKVTLLATNLSCLPLYYPLHEMSEEEIQLHKDMIDDDPLSIDRIADLKPNGYNDDEEPVFRHWSIYDFTSKYKTGETTPTQVAKQIIQVVKATKSKNPLIVLMDEEDIIRQANESSKRYEAGHPQGVLDGVPIAIKDEIPVKGYHIARGTSFMREEVDEDLPPIAKLRNEGAIILGKTNQHEIGLGTTGYNQVYGTPKNPYNTNHYTGGSSSGSAAAVAAGIVPLAIGTDGGGSIRIPSALCGVYGIKPTFKRISVDFDLAPSVESIGPIAGNLNDVALAYAIMAGSTVDDFRHQSLKQPEVHLNNYINPTTLLHNIKIGYFKAHIEDSEPAMLNGTMRAIEFYKSLGAQIVEVEIPHLQEIHLAHAITILTEMNTFVTRKYYKTNKNDFTGDVQISLELARSLSSCDFLSAQKVKALAMETMEELFKSNIDVLISPATASPAPKLENDVLSYGESNLRQTAMLMKYVVLGNFTGIPGLVFPIGYESESGLPISIQLQAGHWREDLLFRLAKVGEGLLRNGLKKPDGFIGGGLD